VEGSSLWYHLNHCTRAVPGQEDEGEEGPAAVPDQSDGEGGEDPGEGPSGDKPQQDKEAGNKSLLQAAVSESRFLT